MQFLGHMFRNNPTIEFPDNTMGLRIGIAPTKWLAFGYGCFNANGAWKNLFQNLFHVGQVIFMPTIGELEGHYRFHAWRNGISHTWWSDGETGKAAYGFGVSFDQQVAKPLTLFARYGWQTPNVYDPAVTNADGNTFTIGNAWSFGASLNGDWWHRENDTLAVAIGQALPSGKYRDTAAGGAKNEFHLEAYYRFQINEHIALSPDVQVIWNPFGGLSPDNRGIVTAYGLRTQIDL